MHIYLQDIPHFDSLILSDTLLCKIATSRFLLWLATFPAIYYYWAGGGRADLYLYFPIKCSSFVRDSEKTFEKKLADRELIRDPRVVAHGANHECL